MWTGIYGLTIYCKLYSGVLSNNIGTDIILTSDLKKLVTIVIVILIYRVNVLLCLTAYSGAEKSSTVIHCMVT